jgi:hypothetical protein
MLKIYQGAIRQRTLNPAPHTQAMASPLVPIPFNVQTLAPEDGIIGPASWTSFPYNAAIRMQEVNVVIDATSFLILNFCIFLIKWANLVFRLTLMSEFRVTMAATASSIEQKWHTTLVPNPFRFLMTSWLSFLVSSLLWLPSA